MNISEETKAKFRKLTDENGLTKDDFYQHKHFIIITRSGIEKIQGHHGITVDFEIVKEDLPNYVAIRAIGRKGDTEVVTFSSAWHPENCKSTYTLEVAEKRALSRAVLKLTKLYELYVFGEDEIKA